MDSPSDRIAPAFKKPKDLQGSFHASEDDLGIFDMLGDEEEQDILAVAFAPPKRNKSMPLERTRGVDKTSSFSSSNSTGRRVSRRESMSTVASSASTASTSSSSRSSRSSVKRSKRTGSKSKELSLLEQQMHNLSV